MATIKAFIDLSQSKKLAKILPLESADMCYFNGDIGKISIGGWKNNTHDEDDVPCWSLTALLSVLPKIINNKTLFIATSAALWHISYKNIYTAIDDNLIDACVEMIIKLHEQKLL